MNALEKVQLIQELDMLIHGLNHRALTLFEIARSKQRLRDIFELCDEPCFQKQILQYRALTQPDLAADQFVKTTPYQLSYRGFFYQDYDLEKALYQCPESGWAMLYHPRQGWQIWFIPAKYKTAYISEWGNIHDSYAWLEEQLEFYPNLVQDKQLRAQVLRLDQEIKSPKIVDTLAITDDTLSKTDDESTEPIAPIAAEKIQLSQPKKFAITLGSYDFSVEPATLAKPLLHRCTPAVDTQIIAPHFSIYLSATSKNVTIDMPIFLAEQINGEGEFEQYVLLLGYQDAQQLLSQQADLRQIHQLMLNSIQQGKLHEVQQHWQNLEQLYVYYQNLAQPIWTAQHYYDFIPRTLIRPHKFIHFDEMPADPQTPLLLLEERGKLRLIHGQKRLQIQSQEIALPYLLIKREQGLNWQQIKQVIWELPQPIEVHELYQALSSE